MNKVRSILITRRDCGDGDEWVLVIVYEPGKVDTRYFDEYALMMNWMRENIGL